MDTSEEEAVSSVAKTLLKKPVKDHKPTQNDKDIVAAELKLSRIEGAIEKLHRSQNQDDFCPVVTSAKEKRLLESFR